MPLTNKFMKIQLSILKLPYSLSKAIPKPSFWTLGSHRPFHAVTDTKKVMHSRVKTKNILNFRMGLFKAPLSYVDLMI